MKYRNQALKYMVGGTALTSGAANAAIDVTAATTGIADAQTAILAVLGGLLALSVAVYGVAMVHRFMQRKSGA